MAVRLLTALAAAAAAWCGWGALSFAGQQVAARRCAAPGVGSLLGRPFVASRVAAAAAGEGGGAPPGLPTSAGMMVRQAGEAVLRAFADGVVRQSVRLNLDVVSPPERLSDSGMPALLQDALPLAKGFAQRLGLPGGAAMRELRVSAIDEIGLSSGDVGTLLYRVSEDPAQDVAVVFLGGRNFAVEPSTQSFLDGMKRRLVIMLNSEDAASQFRIENAGKEFMLGGWADIQKLAGFCKTFEAETYYYRSKTISDWPTVVFRAYPHPWEVHIESLSGSVVKVAELPGKPDTDQVEALLAAYDEANGVSAAAKREAFRGRS